MLDLILIIILSALCLLFAGFSTGLLRIILSIIFVLFSPGYSFISALFPKKTSLGLAERIIYSFVLSISVVAVILLLLNTTPYGFTFWSVIIFLFCTIVAASGVAWFRRRKLIYSERFTLELKLRSRLHLLIEWWKKQRPWTKTAYLVLLTLMACTFGVLVFLVTSPKIEGSYTEFYTLGADAKTGNYLKELVVGEPAELTLHVTNFEHKVMEYRVEVTLDGVTIGTVNSIILNHKQEWQNVVTITPETPGTNRELAIQLFQADSNQPYRNLRLWVDVVQAK